MTVQEMQADALTNARSAAPAASPVPSPAARAASDPTPAPIGDATMPVRLPSAEASGCRNFSAASRAFSSERC